MYIRNVWWPPKRILGLYVHICLHGLREQECIASCSVVSLSPPTALCQSRIVHHAGRANGLAIFRLSKKPVDDRLAFKPRCNGTVVRPLSPNFSCSHSYLVINFSSFCCNLALTSQPLLLFHSR